MNRLDCSTLRDAFKAVFVACLVACSSPRESGRPVFTDAMRGRLTSLASKCEEKSGQPKVDLVFSCVAPDDEYRAYFGVFLKETNRIELLHITLREPTKAVAVSKIDAAIVDIVDEQARKLIVDTFQ